jgi:hypothetical protein
MPHLFFVGGLFGLPDLPGGFLGIGGAANKTSANKTAEVKKEGPSLLAALGNGAAEGKVGVNLGRVFGSQLDSLTGTKDGFATKLFTSMGELSDTNPLGQLGNSVAKDAAEGIIEATMDHVVG